MFLQKNRNARIHKETRTLILKMYDIIYQCCDQGDYVADFKKIMEEFERALESNSVNGLTTGESPSDVAQISSEDSPRSDDGSTTDESTP